MAQKKIGISIIIPVYNSEQWIGPTIEHIVEGLEDSGFDAEIIVIDDGSSDKSAEVAKSIVVPKGVALNVIVQPNSGRYLARKVGVSTSTKDNILFIDSRVYVDKDSLRFLSHELRENSDQLWNGHVNIEKKGNPFVRFWDAVVCIAWRKYFRHPKKTSYGIDDFDYYPKGTGFFYVPKKRLLAAMKHFEANTNDLVHSSDDTLLIRFLASRQPINLSPEFSCLYHGRSNFKSFIKHAYHRGQFFIDGFLRPGTRFFYPLLAVLALSLLAVALLLVMPQLTVKLLVASIIVLVPALFIVAKCLGVITADAASLALLSVPFAFVYLAGLWRGVARKYQLANSAVENLTKRRRIINGSIAEYAVAAVLYGVCLYFMTGTVMSNLGTQLYASSGDATAGFLWINATDHTIDPFVSHFDKTNYPFGEDTTGAMLISYVAYWLPMRVLSYFLGPITALNIIMYSGFLFSAMAMYLVVKRLTNNKALAFIGGYAAAFVPYAQIKSAGHISYIFGGALTLLVGAFLSLWSAPKMIKAIALGLAAALAFYIDGYFMLMVLVVGLSLLAAGLLWNLVTRRTRVLLRGQLKMLGVSLLVFAVSILPLLLTFGNQGKEISETLEGNRSNIAVEIRAYRSNVVDFITPQQGSVLWQEAPGVAEAQQYKNQRSNSSENTHYVSIMLYACAAIGAVLLAVRLFAIKYSSLRTLSKEQVNQYLLLFLVCVIGIVLSLSLMFSPEVRVLGITVKLPGAWLIEHNISLWRVMSRLFVAYNVLVVLGSLAGLSLIVRAFHERGRLYSAWAVVGLVLVGVIAEYATIFPSRPYDFTRQPETYSWLRSREDIKSVIMLPLVDPLDYHTGDYVTAQIVHGKNLINNKYPSTSRLNSTLGDSLNAESRNFIYDRKPDAVVFMEDTGKCGKLGVGSVVHKEATVRYDMQMRKKVDTTLCTLRVNYTGGVSFDPVYAVFREGFSPSAGAPDQSDVAFTERSAGVVRFALGDMKTRYNGMVLLTANLRLLVTVPNSTWSLTQKGTVVASGDVTSTSLAAIRGVVNGADDVQIVISTPNYKLKLAEAYLENVNAQAVKD